MRRIAAVFSLCLGIALVAAAPPRPTPTPAPTPTSAAAPHVTALPIVVVFPFGTSSDLPAADGQKAANLFVEQMNAAGGVDTIGAAPTIKPNDYLSYAKSVDADYYVTGYMMPVGAGVSLVEQVVSTASGTMEFGQTAQIQSFADASAAAVAIHDNIIAREQSLHAQYQEAQASATATPLPNNQANIGKGLSDIAGLFHRNKGKSATSNAAVVKPSKGVFVAHVTGSVPANDLSAATSLLYADVDHWYNAHMTNASGTNLNRQADSVCGSQRDNTIATGTLSATSSRHLLATRTEWTFKLQIYTCWGAVLSEHSATAGSIRDAVHDAVADYAKAHPQNS